MARFLTIAVRCSNCGARWEARGAIVRFEGELYLDYSNLACCLLCGAEGAPTEDAVTAIADALDSEEALGPDPFATEG